MALKKCKECGKEISSSTKKCPGCGKDQRNWFMRHKILTIIIILVVIGIAGAGNSSPENSTSNDNSSATKQAEEQTTYEEINTTVFIEDFDNNQLAAEKKYKDKGVQLSARIKNISEDIIGTPFLSLEPSNADDYYMGTTIQCMFENEDALLNVSNGQTVTVKGMVSEQSLGIIGIKDCQIIE